MSLTGQWCLASEGNFTPFNCVLTEAPTAPRGIQQSFSRRATGISRQSRGTTRDAPRLSADLPAIAPFLHRLRFLLATNHLLLSTIAHSSFSIAAPHLLLTLLSRLRGKARNLELSAPETPDRCREGLTSELSLLGPVSSSVDLTSSQETHTLPDSPAPSQAPSYTIPRFPRPLSSDHCTLCTLQTPSSSRRPYLLAPSPHCRDSLQPALTARFLSRPPLYIKSQIIEIN